MTTPNERAAAVRELVLDTVWSQWAELGLSGWERRHRLAAIDLEALIVATARLREDDPRLWGEAVDWCVHNGRRWVSAVRLKHLGAGVPEFGEFAATVGPPHSTLRWAGATHSARWAPTGRSQEPDLNRPALMQLRLRAVFGVTARAEALRVLLTESGRFMLVSQVAGPAAFGHDAIADALDTLQRGGILDATTTGNHRLFKLGQHEDDLLRLVGSQPAASRADLELPIVVDLLRLHQSAPASELAWGANVERWLGNNARVLTELGVITAHLGHGRNLVDDFHEWVLRFLQALVIHSTDWADGSQVQELRQRALQRRHATEDVAVERGETRRGWRCRRCGRQLIVEWDPSSETLQVLARELIDRDCFSDPMTP